MCWHDDWKALECRSRFYLSFSPSQQHRIHRQWNAELSGANEKLPPTSISLNCFSLAIFWMSTQRRQIQMKIQIRQFGLYANEKVRNQNWKLNFVVFHSLSTLLVAILLLMSFILTRFFHPCSDCALFWVNSHTPHTCRYWNSDISQAKSSHRNEIRSLAKVPVWFMCGFNFPKQDSQFQQGV